MARCSYYVFALISTALCLVHIQATSDNVCEYNCVVDVYSSHCGGATCVSNALPGMEQQICNQRCLDALAGGPLTSCLSILPPFQARAAELAGTISTNVEGFCIGIGFPITDAAAPVADVEGPVAAATGPATQLPEGPETVDEPEPPTAAVPFTAEPPIVVSPIAETPTIDVETPETVEPAVEPAVIVPVPSESGPIEAPDETPEEPAEEPGTLPPAPAPTPEVPAPTPAAPFFDEVAAPPSLGDYDFDELEEDSMLQFLLDV